MNRCPSAISLGTPAWSQVGASGSPTGAERVPGANVGDPSVGGGSLIHDSLALHQLGARTREALLALSQPFLPTGCGSFPANGKELCGQIGAAAPCFFENMFSNAICSLTATL